MINNIMKRLSELPNITMDDGQEYIQLYDAMETVKRALEQEPCEDTISRQAVIDEIFRSRKNFNNEFDQGFFADKIRRLLSITPQPRTGHCEDCEHFRKLPYHIDILGKCICHTGFCPRGDWYCADYEPQERSDKE